jgi:hypothetical protein
MIDAEYGDQPSQLPRGTLYHDESGLMFGAYGHNLMRCVIEGWVCRIVWIGGSGLLGFIADRG